ncbi:adenosine kinase, partial [Zobellia sp.]|nr:adenosine kinase [Zobellia sp.]
VGCKTPTKNLFKNGAYDRTRAKLIEDNKAQRFSASVVLNSEEKTLNAKLVALRKKMKLEYDSLGVFPPAQPFEKYKSHVEQTRLFKLLRKMPKGAIHHLHPAAGVDFEWLIDQTIKQPKSYVYWDEVSGDTGYIKGQIEFFDEKKIPSGFYSTSELDKNNTHFKDELFGLLTLTKEPTVDSLDIWIEFENIFQRIDGAYQYKPLFEAYMKNVIGNLINDSIMHMETRLFLGKKYEINAAGERITYPIDTTVQLLKRVVEKTRTEHPGFTQKAIYTSLRSYSNQKISKELVTAFQLRKKYPEFIKGFDLVAEEDKGHTTQYFENSWKLMDSLKYVYGIDMPLYLHDGESNSQSVDNLFDAVLLQSKRIGHGFNLMNFPKLVDLVIENDICIEVSPLSNQILGYVKDLRLHPASLMLRHGVQCSISSDDPAIFNYTGLSYDYWYSIMAWELDLRDIKKLVLNSITYSSLNPDEKREALDQLEKSWMNFVNYGNAFL